MAAIPTAGEFFESMTFWKPRDSPIVDGDAVLRSARNSNVCGVVALVDIHRANANARRHKSFVCRVAYKSTAEVTKAW